MSQNYRDESRKNWAASSEKPSLEQLTFGCLQRIADEPRPAPWGKPNA